MISQYDFNQFFSGANISEDNMSLVRSLTTNRNVQLAADVPHGADKRRSMTITCRHFVFVVVRHDSGRITVRSVILINSDKAVERDLQAITTLQESHGT